MSDKKQFAKKKDTWIILGLLVLAIAIWGIFMLINNRSRGPYAEIIFQGTTIGKVYLSEDQSFTIPGKPEVELEVRDNAISFAHSDCPDQVCVHTGWLTNKGHFAACLPNQVLVWVDSDDADTNSVDITAK